MVPFIRCTARAFLMVSRRCCSDQCPAHSSTLNAQANQGSSATGIVSAFHMSRMGTGSSLRRWNSSARARSTSVALGGSRSGIVAYREGDADAGAIAGFTIADAQRGQRGTEVDAFYSGLMQRCVHTREGDVEAEAA